MSHANLPVLYQGDVLVVADEQGELIALVDAPDGVILGAYERVAEADRELKAAKTALAAELRARHGVGSSSSAGFSFKVTEAQSWPQARTKEALMSLVEKGVIRMADLERAMPLKRVPDARALKALVGRLMVKDPGAAQVLADACTISPPALREVHPDAIRGEVA